MVASYYGLCSGTALAPLRTGIVETSRSYVHDSCGHYHNAKNMNAQLYALCGTLA